MSRARPLPTAPKKSKALGRLRPLLVRPGATYACFGDGLCCTDVHAIGPIARKERVYLSIVADGLVAYDPNLRTHALKMKKEDGTCALLDSERRCMIHEAMEGLLLPSTCRRFPLGLTATPDGGRVTLEHRCSCQNLGDAPPLEIAHADRVLRDGRGRLKPNHRVGDRIPMSRRSRVKWATYVEHERALLERLETEDPLEVLGFTGIDPAAHEEWRKIGRGMTLMLGDTRFDAAMHHFGDALQALAGETKAPPERARPWAFAYEAAESRTEAGDTRPIYRAWIADAIWMLYWTATTHFEGFRRDLALRLAAAQVLERWAVERGMRADRAAAEAITIVDLCGTSDWWEAIARRELR